MSNNRCFILGSGPSIKNEDLRILKNETTFCTNWFLNHDEFDSLNINYYCTYDEAFVRPQINQKWIENLKKYESMIKIFPKAWENFFYKFALKNVKYVNYAKDIKIYKKLEFNLDEKVGFYDGGTVVINLCIPFAINLGYKEIILLGCDTSYYNKKDLDPYFYDITKHETAFESSLNRNELWQKNVLDSYEVLNKTTQKLNIKIYDATKNGKIECFEKVTLLEFINKVR